MGITVKVQKTKAVQLILGVSLRYVVTVRLDFKSLLSHYSDLMSLVKHCRGCCAFICGC